MRYIDLLASVAHIYFSQEQLSKNSQQHISIASSSNEPHLETKRTLPLQCKNISAKSENYYIGKIFQPFMSTKSNNVHDKLHLYIQVNDVWQIFEYKRTPKPALDKRTPKPALDKRTPKPALDKRTPKPALDNLLTGSLLKEADTKDPSLESNRADRLCPVCKTCVGVAMNTCTYGVQKWRAENIIAPGCGEYDKAISLSHEMLNVSIVPLVAKWVDLCNNKFKI